jgi:shikimate dehydrogenase
MNVPYAEVIGDPVAHSKSPLIHRFWLEKLDLDGAYRAMKVAPEELPAYFADRRADPDWMGANVTIPHKQAAARLVDRLQGAAATIGAANIIVGSRKAKTHLLGYNSDAEGFLEPLRPLLMQPHLFRMARIFGAGGAARAVAHALAPHGFTLVVAARDPGKAEALIGELPGEHHAVALAHFQEPTDFVFDDRQGLLDLVVNASPLGMEDQLPLLLDWSHVPPGSIVYDLVYSPLETRLLAEAKARGHRTIDGLQMLVGQAAAAFELFFGRPAPREHDAELREMLAR